MRRCRAVTTRVTKLKKMCPIILEIMRRGRAVTNWVNKLEILITLPPV